MYFSDKYFFLFYFDVCYWMNICHLYWDAFWYTVFLPIVACSSCICQWNIKMQLLLFWILFHAFDNNFYDAALNVLPEAPCTDGLPLRIKCNLNSSHQMKQKCLYLKMLLNSLSWIKKDWNIINIVNWQTVPCPGYSSDLAA